MNKDEVLILKPQFPVKAETMHDIHKKLIEQAKTGVVLIPFGYEVVVKPKQIEIELEPSAEKIKGKKEERVKVKTVYEPSKTNEYCGRI